MKILKALAVFILSISTTNAATLKVGVTAGPHAMIMEKVRDLAKADGIDIQIVEFNDFVTPNIALNDKAIDLNSYQHQPYLDDQIKTRGYKFKAIGKTVLMPLGIYSKKIKSMKDLKDGSKIAIPNDPTNGGRALKLLEKEGLIKLKSVDNPSVLDISENVRKFAIIEIDAPQVPWALEDVEVAVINTDWVLLAGLDPQSALAREDKENPYANVIAARVDENRPEVAKFVSIYQSDAVKAFINEKFKGAVIPAW
jgi:D-methionine transport system substrate-binding protein